MHHNGSFCHVTGVIEINDPPWFASLATRSVAGTVGRKVSQFCLNIQIF